MLILRLFSLQGKTAQLKGVSNLGSFAVHISPIYITVYFVQNQLYSFNYSNIKMDENFFTTEVGFVKLKTAEQINLLGSY